MRFVLSLFVTLALPIIFTGCGRQSEEVFSEGQLEPMAPITGVAWGERVMIRKSGIPKTPQVAITANGQAIPVVYQDTGKVVFDLPKASFTYNALPTSSANYKNRGTVAIKINGKNTAPTYQPFGAVVSGQLSLLVQFPGAPDTCSGFYTWLHNLSDFNLVDPPFPVPSELKTYATNLWCYATVSFTKLDTKDAITALRNQIIARPDHLTSAHITISRNVVFSSDGEDAYDPGCKQTQKWLDPEALDFQTLNATQLKQSVNAGAAHSANIKGNGVTVALIGGGVNPASLTRPGQILTGHNFLAPGQLPQDDFKCDLDGDGQRDDFFGHDTWVAEMINTIAPQASVDPLKVCDAEGSCPSDKITEAFIYVINSYVNTPNPRRVILHLSLGGPLENETQETILTHDDANRAMLLLVASAGNGGEHAGEHYPASYAEGLTVGTGVLENVVSIGAMGKDLTNKWLEADFTVDGNYNLLAAGVDSCPKATTFRCNVATPGGFNGTSFAAPIATGVAALYVQDLSTPTPPVPLDSLDIRACLVANTAPTTQPLFFPANSVWYNPAAVCP